jgi:NADH-quinone oxidoreductase subunit J
MTLLLAAGANQRNEVIVFWLMAIVAVAAAVAMVLNRNAVYSALLLVVNFFALSVLYLLLQAQFLWVVQLIVYAGAIMVLFLFVLMLLGVRREEILREPIKGQRVAAAVLAVVLLVALGGAIFSRALSIGWAGLDAANQAGNVEAVGALLFNRYAFAFELTGVLLVVAAIGALVLGKCKP